MNLNNEPYYFTKILTNINYSILESYIINKKNNNNLSDDIIQKLEDCRCKICNSKTYLELSKKQNLSNNTTNDRWKMINIKKNLLSNIYIIFNKLTADNIDNILEEMKLIKLSKYEEFIKIADIYAGKSTLETENLSLLINFLKKINFFENWYIKHDDYIYSFRELVLITIQKEFIKLIDMAGDMEIRYKDTKIEEVTNEYIKKKKIIIGLIKLLAELYNNQFYSDIVNSIILKKLYDEYNKNHQDIYLELFIIYFKYTFNFKKIFNIDIYNDIIKWLHYIYNNNNITSKISYLISDILIHINNNDNIIDNESNDINQEYNILYLDDQLEYIIKEYLVTNDLEDMLKTLKNKNYDNTILLDYIYKYLASSIDILIDENINKIIKTIINYFNIPKNTLLYRLKELISDDEILSELPLLEKIKIDNFI